jgi:hypothetical protein
MITEKITFNFESEAQQKRFHKELERRDLGCMSAFAEGWKARAEAVPLLQIVPLINDAGEVSWLTRKLGRALKYIEDGGDLAMARTFAELCRMARPDLPKFLGNEEGETS